MGNGFVSVWKEFNRPFDLIVILIGGTVDDLSKISHGGIPVFFELVERESPDLLQESGTSGSVAQHLDRRRPPAFRANDYEVGLKNP